MIGKKKLTEMQADVADAFAEQGIDANEWFAARIAKLQAGKKPDQRELETLTLLRNTIADARKRTESEELAGR